jgi:hypothetical protein
MELSKEAKKEEKIKLLGVQMTEFWREKYPRQWTM